MRFLFSASLLLTRLSLSRQQNGRDFAEEFLRGGHVFVKLGGRRNQFFSQLVVACPRSQVQCYESQGWLKPTAGVRQFSASGAHAEEAGPPEAQDRCVLASHR